jgi:hypothetical protein
MHMGWTYVPLRGLRIRTYSAEVRTVVRIHEQAAALSHFNVGRRVAAMIQVVLVNCTALRLPYARVVNHAAVHVSLDRAPPGVSHALATSSQRGDDLTPFSLQGVPTLT